MAYKQTNTQSKVMPHQHDTSDINGLDLLLQEGLVDSGDTAPEDPAVGKLWYDTTTKILKVYDGTTWLNVGPEIYPMTKAEYEALSDTEKNSGKFYFITDNDGTIIVNWDNIEDKPDVALASDVSSVSSQVSTLSNTVDSINTTVTNINDKFNGGLLTFNKDHFYARENGSETVLDNYDSESSTHFGGGSITIESHGEMNNVSPSAAISASGENASVRVSKNEEDYDNDLGVTHSGYLTPQSIKYSNYDYIHSVETTTEFPFAGSERIAKLTDIPDVSQFVTSEEVNDMVSNFGGFEVVTELPDSDMKTNIIYLKGPIGELADKYEEWIYSESTGWTQIGETSVDLTNYATSAELSNLQSEVGQKADSSYVATIDSTATSAYNLAADASNAVTTAQDTANAAQDTAQQAYNAAANKVDYPVRTTNITIANHTQRSNRGPVSYDYHIPTEGESDSLKSIMDNLGLANGDGYKKYLHMPFAGCRRRNDASVYSQGSDGRYWSSSPSGSANPVNARNLYLYPANVYANSSNLRAYGFSVRCFCDDTYAPGGEQIFAGSTEGAGIWLNSDKNGEQILIVSDGTDTICMKAMNQGAWEIYNDGDELTEANCGQYFQWGNNYGFAFEGDIETSDVQVNTDGYIDSTYYGSSFIVENGDWSNPSNDKLWGIDSYGNYTETSVSSWDVSMPDTSTNWGNIGGDINNQSDLQSVLENKADQSYVTDVTSQLNESIQNKLDNPAILRGIQVGSVTTRSNVGPAMFDFHIPSRDEWYDLDIVMQHLGLGTSAGWRQYLGMPYAGRVLSSNGDVTEQGTKGYFWTCTPGSDGETALWLELGSQYPNLTAKGDRAAGASLRMFSDALYPKDALGNVSILYDGSSYAEGAGIFMGTAGVTQDVVITATDGNIIITMSAFNVGAGSYYSVGDELNQENCGQYFQWGNNYGFEWGGSFAKSTEQVDTTGYKYSNYSGDSFIYGNTDWSNPSNDLLWSDTGPVVNHSTLIALNEFLPSGTLEEGKVLGFDGSGYGWVPQPKASVEAVTQEEYDALSEEQKNDGVFRIIKDAPAETLPFIEVMEDSPITGVKAWFGTQEQYDALESIDNNGMYVILS